MRNVFLQALDPAGQCRLIALNTQLENFAFHDLMIQHHIRGIVEAADNLLHYLSVLGDVSRILCKNIAELFLVCLNDTRKQRTVGIHHTALTR